MLCAVPFPSGLVLSASLEADSVVVKEHGQSKPGLHSGQ